MQRINFQLAETIYLVQGDRWYDLHNDYDFTALRYDPPSQGLTLRWEGGRWGQLGNLELHFQMVDHFSVHTRDPEMPYTEDTTLATVAYLSPEDLNENRLDWLEEEQQATDQSFLNFSFHSGQRIVVRSQRVSLEIFEESPEAPA